MRKAFIFLAVFLLLPIVASAPDLEVEKIDKGSVVISELDNPAVFDFKITNKNQTDDFEIFSLVGVAMTPQKFFELPKGETTTIEVTANPNEELRKIKGFLNFEYRIYGRKSGVFKDNLLIKIVPLSEAVEILPAIFNPNDSEIVITIRNKENTHIENLSITLKSVFFEKEDTISLSPYEERNISIKVDKEKIRKITAGQYVLTGEIQVQDSRERIESTINYLEEESVSVNETKQGIIVRKVIVTKTNLGNVPTTATIEIKKDVLSRLFTINSPIHSDVERRGLITTYIWQKEIAPGESVTVTSSTNYTFPFVIFILLVVTALSVKYYTSSPLTINKKVSHVKTKGGEFALKVNLYIKSKKHLTNIQIKDRLPAMTKLYEKFGTKPSQIHSGTRTLSWHISSLNSGETRVISYIIYSKIRTFGRFELPPASASFVYNDKEYHTLSDRVFFVSDTSENL